MIYIVKETFNDRVLGGKRLKDSVYPPPGVSVPEEWLEKLAGKDNACGRPFIAPFEENPKAAEAPEDNKPKEGKGGK